MHCAGLQKVLEDRELDRRQSNPALHCGIRNVETNGGLLLGECKHALNLGVNTLKSISLIDYA